jgi:hypothetical protein
VHYEIASVASLPRNDIATQSLSKGGLGGFEPYYFLCKEERDQNRSWY